MDSLVGQLQQRAGEAAQDRAVREAQQAELTGQLAGLQVQLEMVGRAAGSHG